MRFLILFFCFSLLNAVSAQELNLANQYFNDGEYEKATEIYKSLHTNNPGADIYFTRLLACYTALRKFDEAESMIRKEISRRPKDAQLLVHYGDLLSQKGEEDKANKTYKDAIKNLESDPLAIHRLGNAFIEKNKYDLAIEVFEKGNKLTQGAGGFSYNIADVYRRKGDIQKMLENYIDGLDNNTIQVNSLKNVLIAYLPVEKYSELQTMIYDKLDKKPDDIAYLDLLQWLFVQKKDFPNAMRQAKSLDKLQNGNGSNVFDLATIIENETDFKTAIDGYAYIKNLGEASPFYLEAVRHILICRKNQIILKNDYTKQDLLALESDYESFMQTNSRSRVIAPILMEFAELEARYINNIPKAIEILKALVINPIIDIRSRSLAKLDLADYYLIQGERWESTLLYSQVDKDYMEDQLGEMARFKNAKLSYFAGDFKWAQEQFDILKQATSKLISNDAIDLSVFIMDNLNQDSTGAALSDYSQAELLVFQNKYSDALTILDSITSQYKDNSLVDDVWYLEGLIYNKQKNTEQAIKKFESVVEKYKEDIRADNALYELAKIYDYQLDDKDKAKTYYEKLYTDYSGSVLAVESRKRYRVLRGDANQ